MPMRKETRCFSQGQQSSQTSPLFLRLDGQEGFEHGRDSMRFGQRCVLAALSLQGITEARGAAFAVAERI